MKRSLFLVGMLWSMTGLVDGVQAQPREWQDDFTTATTYDTNSLFAPCDGGPPPKYTAIELFSSDVYNQRAVSGGGMLRLSALNMDSSGYDVGRGDLYVVGWLGIGSGCPGEPPLKTTSEPFTSNDVCIYGGWMWNNWQMWDGALADDVYGVDHQPGFAGVDDDSDGTTDEVGTEYPDTGGEYPGTGPDGQPGVAGVDDDGINGVDDLGEQKWPGSDDSDDENGDVGQVVGMELDVATLSMVHVTFGPAENSGSNSIWNMRHWVDSTDASLTHGNEISSGFYEPYVHYNYVFCVSGTVFGARLWSELDMANPNETLGPVTNSQHTDAVDNAIYVAVAMKGPIWTNIDAVCKIPYKNYTYLGNSNFCDTFWVVSGNPAQHYPSPSPDLDGDKDVDGFDFLTFSNCYNGSNRLPLAACASDQADLDKDGDVDGFDFLTFSNCYNGSNRRPLAACFPGDVTGS